MTIMFRIFFLFALLQSFTVEMYDSFKDTLIESIKDVRTTNEKPVLQGDESVLCFPIYLLSEKYDCNSLIDLIDFVNDPSFQFGLIKDCNEICYGIRVNVQLKDSLSKRYAEEPEEYVRKDYDDVDCFVVSTFFWEEINKLLKEHPDMNIFLLYPFKDFWGIEKGRLYHITCEKNQIRIIDGQKEFQFLLDKYGRREILALADVTEFRPHQMNLDYTSIRRERFKFLKSFLYRKFRRKGSYFPAQLAPMY